MSAAEPPVSTPLRAVVSLDALRENLALIRRTLGAGTELIACVKANAYGHGLRGIAACLEAEGVRWLSLGSPAGALDLRRWGIACNVLLFPTGIGGHPAPLLEAGITVSVQSFDEAVELARAARARPPSIFLKVDSGLGRVGAPLGEAVGLAARIRAELPDIRLAGVFTHLPFGGPDSVTWVEERLAAFGRVAAEIRAATPGPLLVQALASAGVAGAMKAPEANAVCPGSLLYGIEPAWLSTPLGTRPVLTEVRTVLETIRAIPPGTRYGYGGGRVGHARDPARRAADRLLELHPRPEGGAEGPRGRPRGAGALGLARACRRGPERRRGRADRRAGVSPGGGLPGSAPPSPRWRRSKGAPHWRCWSR